MSSTKSLFTVDSKANVQATLVEGDLLSLDDKVKIKSLFSLDNAEMQRFLSAVGAQSCFDLYSRNNLAKRRWIFNEHTEMWDTESYGNIIPGESVVIAIQPGCIVMVNDTFVCETLKEHVKDAVFYSALEGVVVVVEKGFSTWCSQKASERFFNVTSKYSPIQLLQAAGGGADGWAATANGVHVLTPTSTFDALKPLPNSESFVYTASGRVHSINGPGKKSLPVVPLLKKTVKAGVDPGVLKKVDQYKSMLYSMADYSDVEYPANAIFTLRGFDGTFLQRKFLALEADTSDFNSDRISTGPSSYTAYTGASDVSDVMTVKGVPLHQGTNSLRLDADTTSLTVSLSSLFRWLCNAPQYTQASLVDYNCNFSITRRTKIVDEIDQVKKKVDAAMRSTLRILSRVVSEWPALSVVPSKEFNTKLRTKLMAEMGNTSLHAGHYKHIKLNFICDVDFVMRTISVASDLKSCLILTCFINELADRKSIPTTLEDLKQLYSTFTTKMSDPRQLSKSTSKITVDSLLDGCKKTLDASVEEVAADIVRDVRNNLTRQYTNANPTFGAYFDDIFITQGDRGRPGYKYAATWWNKERECYIYDTVDVEYKQRSGRIRTTIKNMYAQWIWKSISSSYRSQLISLSLKMKDSTAVSGLADSIVVQEVRKCYDNENPAIWKHAYNRNSHANGRDYPCKGDWWWWPSNSGWYFRLAETGDRCPWHLLDTSQKLLGRGEGDPELRISESELVELADLLTASSELQEKLVTMISESCQNLRYTASDIPYLPRVLRNVMIDSPGVVKNVVEGLSKKIDAGLTATEAHYIPVAAQYFRSLSAPKEALYAPINVSLMEEEVKGTPVLIKGGLLLLGMVSSRYDTIRKLFS